MKSSSRYFIHLCFLWVFASSFAQTEPGEWTRFRGTDGRGLDTKWSAPVSWDSSDYRWDIALPGKGNASPVVWGNTIFVTSCDDEKGSGFLFAIDGQDGAILWQKEFFVTDLAMHVDNKLAAATPLVDESQVYVIWYSKEKTELTALSHAGIIQWQSDFEGIKSRHGGGSSLTLAGTNVVFTREQEKDYSSLKSSWLAVDIHTGETVWELERESPESNSFATPLLLETLNGGTQLIFGSQSHGITIVDPENGKILLEKKEMMPARVVASPFYAGGKLIFCSKGQAMAIGYDPEKVMLADAASYALPRNLSPYVPTPIAVGELLFLYMDSGVVACVRLDTGELLWKERPAGAIYGSPICVGENLYCITKEGEVSVIGADSTYQLKGIYKLGDGSFSTPVMCNSGLVFRTFTRLTFLGSE